MPNRVPMTHPGIGLREEFFEPLGITQSAAAAATGIPQSRLSEILAGRRSITADTAVRLGRYFNVDPTNWLNLQTHFDIETLERTQRAELRKITPRNPAPFAGVNQGLKESAAGKLVSRGSFARHAKA